MIYHDDVAPISTSRPRHVIPVEVGVECLVPPEVVATRGTPGVSISETREGFVATTEHIGPRERLADAQAAVRAWCAAKGWAITGLSWEVYRDAAVDPAWQRTGVYYLVR